jgi:replicative DNA helicase
MIGDGSCVKRQPIRYASIDELNLAAVTKAAAHFGVTTVRDEYAAARVTTLRLPAPYRLTHGKRNPIAAWLDKLGLFGKRSHEKFVPQEVFALPNDQIALFLRHLWATDGSVRWDFKVKQGRIYYASTSRCLVDDIMLLLLRFGINSRIYRTRKMGYRESWQLHIFGAENQRKFLQKVDVNGEKFFAAREVLAQLERVTARANSDTVPVEVWNKVKSHMSERRWTDHDFALATNTRFDGEKMWTHAPGRKRLHRIAMVFDDRNLHDLTTNDVFWDKIVDIISMGKHDVYDGTVSGTHNFVANLVDLHNSLEQDADMVILLHRPDAFERDDPRGGEADLILGKHRNGPTKTITLAHQLHLSRFTNMAKP